MQDHDHFSMQDFLCDEAFQNWVLHPDAASDAYWEQWMEQHPQQRPAIFQAKAFLRELRFVHHLPEEGTEEQSLKQVLLRIEEIERAPVTRPALIRRIFNMSLSGKIAAACLFVLLLAGYFLFIHPSRNEKPQQFATSFGKQQQLTLSDGSSVVLNANSSVTLKKPWSDNVPRELWLTGEAFFKVVHRNADSTQIREADRFLVHTDDLTVEVLGTAFNIRNRRGKTEVMLQQGKISVRFNDSSKAPVVLRPGDLLVYDPAEKEILQRTASPEKYVAWKEKKLLLEDPSVAAIIAYLEDNYGVTIRLDDPQLATRKIEGPILLDNLEDPLFILSTVLNIDIQRNDSLLIFKTKPTKH
ncbi:hypothetical protein HHL16_15240 [Pseudoflavitalea sp. G-6-1-2]|uniref:FecR family protein n=1 Tax=Pseudoflavitalea sp. G-6-1-2 TaxID=2728841 RepID=UPI00146BF375|nr:FecR domain-containing protein [Pseudoflavitalea sp. G-6-1-2]NML22237.1 hypothetical protein [Pseudoflavitalea sp. G-6-1-2]